MTMELERTQSESIESARKSQALKAQRQRETASRYITALRQRLLYQLKEKNMEVPPLCSCADAVGAFRIQANQYGILAQTNVSFATIQRT